MLERLSDRAFDYRNTVILEEPALGLTPPQEPPAKTAIPEVVVKPKNEGYTDILVDVPASGFIFLDDIYMPGWRAFVDGEKTKILRADYLFMVVPVEAGKHTIEVQYAPTGFYVGRWISLISAACLLLLLGYDAATRQAKKAAPWERIRSMVPRGRKKIVPAPVGHLPARKQQIKRS